MVHSKVCPIVIVYITVEGMELAESFTACPTFASSWLSVIFNGFCTIHQSLIISFKSNSACTSDSWAAIGPQPTFDKLCRQAHVCHFTEVLNNPGQELHKLFPPKKPKTPTASVSVSL